MTKFAVFNRVQQSLQALEKPKRIKWYLLKTTIILNTLEYILIQWNSANQARNDNVQIVKYSNRNIQNIVWKYQVLFFLYQQFIT